MTRGTRRAVETTKNYGDLLAANDAAAANAAHASEREWVPAASRASCDERRHASIIPLWLAISAPLQLRKVARRPTSKWRCCNARAANSKADVRATDGNKTDVRTISSAATPFGDPLASHCARLAYC